MNFVLLICARTRLSIFARAECLELTLDDTKMGIVGIFLHTTRGPPTDNDTSQGDTQANLCSQ